MVLYLEVSLIIIRSLLLNKMFLSAKSFYYLYHHFLESQNFFVEKLIKVQTRGQRKHIDLWEGVYNDIFDRFYSLKALNFIEND